MNCLTKYVDGVKQTQKHYEHGPEAEKRRFGLQNQHFAYSMCDCFSKIAHNMKEYYLFTNVYCLTLQISKFYELIVQNKVIHFKFICNIY